MKTAIQLVALALMSLAIAACASNPPPDQQTYQRKIYLTEEDYLEDLAKHAELERREAKPNTESEYIFEVLPETQKNVYFFDERVRPMVPGEPSEREYKNTKRLWQKPKRYSPDQYYGNSSEQDASNSSDSDSSYSSDYNY